MFKKRHLQQALMFALIAIIFASCYPRKDVYTDDYDLAGTFYDVEQDFKEFKTIFVVDSVFHIVDEDEENNLDISRKYDKVTLDLVKQNFLDYGYEFITDPETETPDVVIVVSALATRVTVIYSYPWGGYYPGWGGWWGGYYPYYPWGTVGGYSYDIGTIYVDMYDTEGYDPGSETQRVPWQAAINGLMGGYSADVQSRITYNMNQCFIQSPYLNLN